MNFDEAEKEIRKFFDTAWGTTTKIAWPDVKFTIPKDKTWVRFNCVESDGSQVSMGSPSNNRFRHFGLVTIQVFQPQLEGSGDAREKATTALAAFMGQQTTNGVVFNNVTANQIGNDGKGFYQINVIASFYYDEIT